MVKQNIVKKLIMNQPLSNLLVVWTNQRFSHRFITVYCSPIATTISLESPCERCYSVIQCLKQIFGNRFTMWCAAFLGLFLSPEVTPCDFFLLWHQKVNVFLTLVPDLLLLKSRIQAEIGEIWKEMLLKVYENALVRFHIYIGNDDYHLPKGGYTLWVVRANYVWKCQKLLSWASCIEVDSLLRTHEVMRAL